LDEAVASGAGWAPAHLGGMVRAGVRAGDLGGVLERFQAVSRVGSDLRRSFRIGLAYPILAVALTLVVFLLVDMLIVDRFENIFRDFGVPLPTMTIVLLAISHLVRFLGPFLIAGFLALLVAWAVFGLVSSRAARNALIARIPVVGSLWRYTAWSEFCHLLAMLIESKVPLPEALRMTGEAVEDRGIDRACRSMARSVEGGRALSAAMAGGVGDRDDSGAIRRAMPRGLPRLLKWAEDRAAVAEVLRVAGETFQARSRAEAAFGGAAAGFLAVVAVIVGFFVVVVGMFLPLITLVSRLSG